MLVAVINRGGNQPYLITKMPWFGGWLTWRDTFTPGIDPDHEEQDAYRWILFWSAVDEAEAHGWVVENKFDEERVYS